MSCKPPIDLELLIAKLKLQLARDLQKLGHPTKCRCCGGSVVARRGYRKLALLGRRLERVLSGDLSGEVRHG